jgi:hypothetical protein
MKKTFRKELEDGSIIIIAEARFDDDCKNGHNTFAITAEVYDETRRNGEQSQVGSKGRRYMTSCGCQHDLVVQHFPELAPLIKWHLTSTDGPMHYIANTIYHVEQGKLDYARSSAVVPDATPEQLGSREWLAARLPDLMREFRAAVESLGFVYE